MVASEKVDTAKKMLTEGVAAVIESNDFQQVLDMMGKFHRYSISNTMLIISQKPNASRVAGFKTWQGMGRVVRKGEKGIQIFVPHIRKPKESDEDQKPQMSFGVGYVFDIEQTEGDELPTFEVTTWLEGESTEGVIEAVAEWIKTNGITVDLHSAEVPDTARGYWDSKNKEIHVSAICDGKQRAKTLIHETAHALTNPAYQDHRQNEAIAEGTAYIVSNYFGMDTSEQSFGYIASWCTDQIKFLQTVGEIQRIAHAVIEGVEAEMAPTLAIT